MKLAHRLAASVMVVIGGVGLGVGCVPRYFGEVAHEAAVVDYVIRPRLVRGEGELPALVTFTALFGGVEVFGLKGLIVGPVLMSLAIAVLRLYASEARTRRSAPPRSRTDAPSSRSSRR